MASAAGATLGTVWGCSRAIACVQDSGTLAVLLELLDSVLRFSFILPVLCSGNLHPQPVSYSLAPPLPPSPFFTQLTPPPYP